MTNNITNQINAELLKEVFDKNNSLWVKVNGKSMFPVFLDNSLVCIRRTIVENIFIGDIIVFHYKGNIISHRLFSKIKFNGLTFLKTRGDISFDFDPLVSQDRVIGKVTALKNFGLTINIDNLGSRIIGLFISYVTPFIKRFVYYLKDLKVNICNIR